MRRVVARRILDRLEAPLEIDGRDGEIDGQHRRSDKSGAEKGQVQFVAHPGRPANWTCLAADLLHRADRAMYRAKSLGGELHSRRRCKVTWRIVVRPSRLHCAGGTPAPQATSLQNHEDRPGASLTSDHPGRAGRAQQRLFSRADEAVWREPDVQRARGRRARRSGRSPGAANAQHVAGRGPAGGPDQRRRPGHDGRRRPSRRATRIRYRRSQLRVSRAASAGSRRRRGTPGRSAGRRADRRGRGAGGVHPGEHQDSQRARRRT